VTADHTLAIFAAQLILLLLFGRLLGELMNRVGQPALFGQLLAGVVLGPSVFGVVLPELRHLVFPDDKTLKSMIDAISQIVGHRRAVHRWRGARLRPAARRHPDA
jgi:Kef-type K+ transport system membrane component KefB